MEANRIRQKIDVVLNEIKNIIDICNEEDYVNEQWYIDFEDKLNKFSGIDYSVTPVIVPQEILDLPAGERIERWLNYGVQLEAVH